MERKTTENLFTTSFSNLGTGISSNLPLKNSFYGTSSIVDSNLNPRQIFWIRKRKIRRESLDALMKLKDSNYIYESRHRHAMKRQRAASGRFLTKDELLRMKNEHIE